MFSFGGLARIGREPSSASQEFNIAIAGPISSFTLSGVFYFVGRYSGNLEMVGATSGYYYNWATKNKLTLFKNGRDSAGSSCSCP
jgi:hypothetical protein